MEIKLNWIFDHLSLLLNFLPRQRSAGSLVLSISSVCVRWQQQIVAEHPLKTLTHCWACVCLRSEASARRVTDVGFYLLKSWSTFADVFFSPLRFLGERDVPDCCRLIPKTTQVLAHFYCNLQQFQTQTDLQQWASFTSGSGSDTTCKPETVRSWGENTCCLINSHISSCHILSWERNCSSSVRQLTSWW